MIYQAEGKNVVTTTQVGERVYNTGERCRPAPTRKGRKAEVTTDRRREPCFRQWSMNDGETAQIV